jgi:UDP-N-acetyl-D-glucosamine dehydrogenase
MPYHVVNRLVEAVDRSGRAFSGSKILILGVAYKKNVDDMRESPSLKLIELIEARGARVDYHDPHVPEIPMTREHANLAGRRSVGLHAEALTDYDAVLIATDHDSVNYSLVVENAKIVIDTRNACARAGILDPRVIKA